MNSEEQRERLVDLLLWEAVGDERPPDVRERVLRAARERSLERPLAQATAPRLVPLRSARRSKAPALAVAAVLVLLGVLTTFFVSRNIAAERTPVLTVVSGVLDRADGAVSAGETIRTDQQSRARLTYPDGSAVELTAGTTITLAERTRWDRSKGLEIVAGGVEAEVPPQPSGSPMVLSTEEASAEVIGTRFSLHRRDGGTRLEVQEGSVRFVSQKGSGEALVESGSFGEAGESGFQHGKIPTTPVLGITGFTLMNALTDQPMRTGILADGESISLSSLATPKINIRADYEGEAPASVKIQLIRSDGKATGLPAHATKPHRHPPYFVAGDHWADGRPEDCSPWTPAAGVYQLTARARYELDGEERDTPPLRIRFRITP